MATVYLLLGVPGSGKSFWACRNAERLGATVISSDAIRNGLEAAGRGGGDAAELVFEELADQLGALLAAGSDVIVDATHARKRWRAAQIRVAREQGATVIAVWFDVPLQVCLRRNGLRRGDEWGKRVVPWRVVQGMYRGFEPPEAAEFDGIWRITE